MCMCVCLLSPSLCRCDRLDRGSPLRVLDSKDARDRAVAAGAPALAGFLSPHSHIRFAQLQAALRAVGLPFELDATLVRGLDYYGETVFEYVAAEGQLGAQATVLAGGRYDDLCTVLGGKPTPAVGCVPAYVCLCVCISLSLCFFMLCVHPHVDVGVCLCVPRCRYVNPHVHAYVSVCACFCVRTRVCA
jgi:hypothetical protein